MTSTAPQMLDRFSLLRRIRIRTEDAPEEVLKAPDVQSYPHDVKFFGEITKGKVDVISPTEAPKDTWIVALNLIWEIPMIGEPHIAHDRPSKRSFSEAYGSGLWKSGPLWDSLYEASVWSLDGSCRHREHFCGSKVPSVFIESVIYSAMIRPIDGSKVGRPALLLLTPELSKMPLLEEILDKLPLKWEVREDYMHMPFDVFRKWLLQRRLDDFQQSISDAVETKNVADYLSETGNVHLAIMHYRKILGDLGHIGDQERTYSQDRRFRRLAATCVQLRLDCICETTRIQGAKYWEFRLQEFLYALQWDRTFSDGYTGASTAYFQLKDAMSAKEVLCWGLKDPFLASSGELARALIVLQTKGNGTPGDLRDFEDWKKEQRRGKRKEEMMKGISGAYKAAVAFQMELLQQAEGNNA